MATVDTSEDVQLRLYWQQGTEQILAPGMFAQDVRLIQGAIRASWVISTSVLSGIWFQCLQMADPRSRPKAHSSPRMELTGEPQNFRPSTVTPESCK